MRSALILGSAALCLALGLPTPHAMAQLSANRLTFEDIFSLEMASDPQISPDGDTVAYQRRSNDIMTDQTRSSIWLIGSDGAEHRPLVTGAGDYSNPRWAPDSGRIAYIASEDGKASLNVRWIDASESIVVTALPTGGSGLAWSPDGQWLAFASFLPTAAPELDIGMPRRPEGAQWADPALVDDTLAYEFDGVGEIPDGAMQVFVVSADGGTPRQLTQLTGGSVQGLLWTPDGAELIFSVSAAPESRFDFGQSDLFAVTVGNAQIRPLTGANGTEGSPSLSPDGRTLAYVGSDTRYTSSQDNGAFLLDLASGAVTPLLPELDRSIDEAVWDPAGDGLYIRYDDRGRTVLAYTTTAGRLTRLTDRLSGLSFGRPYTSGSFSVAGDGRYAATLGSPYELANIGVGGRRGEPAAITRLNEDVLGRRELARVEPISWQSSADGREINGWVAFPPGFSEDRRYPFILEIHGGPHTAYGPHFSGEVQLFAAAGYVVLYANPRGSTSYGDEFANLIDKNYPGEDVDDLLSGVDAVMARGFIDPERLFITGGSGGGTLSAQIISVDHRFAAAAIAKPVINWTSFILAADIGPTILPYWFGVMPWEDPEGYWRRSPLSLVGEVQTPSLLLVGAEDRRTPVFEAEQYYNALLLRGIDTRLVRIPGAFHGIADSRPSRLLQKVGHILNWFEAHDPARTAPE